MVAAVDSGRERGWRGGDESVGLCETAVTNLRRRWRIDFAFPIYFVKYTECARMILMHLTKDFWRETVSWL